VPSPDEHGRLSAIRERQLRIIEKLDQELLVRKRDLETAALAEGGGFEVAESSPALVGAGQMSINISMTLEELLEGGLCSR
jgi:hypothetical protein